MSVRELPASVLERRAIVYVRQSTHIQMQENLESQRRQYQLADLARAYGFREVSVIDNDLGRSASGTVERPGFRSLVGQICEGAVGAVFCLEASRLARNGRDWHHLLEFCGLVGARIIDPDGVYDPNLANDRLLLGLKGTMSEFELTLIRQRLTQGARAKAGRGELRLPVPVGYIWQRDGGLAIDPDRRVQDTVRSIYRLFDRFGSARQIHLYMRHEGLLFPRPIDGKDRKTISWRPPVYRNVIGVLQNPFYAGAYAYGKSQVRSKIVNGEVQKKYNKALPIQSWSVLLRDHHEAYVEWETFEHIQERLARNSYRTRAGGAKSARGGKALLAGLLRCHRCGRMLNVSYSGLGLQRYSCRTGHTMHGLAPCISFGARRPDLAIVREILVAVQPIAVEAAVVAARNVTQRSDERQRAIQLERQQAEYEARLAARRYEAVDPENRLVAAELEARWNAAMQHLQHCEVKVQDSAEQRPVDVSAATLLRLATDLESTWNASTTSPRTKQRLIRALINEIVVDVDDATREVVLVIHWRGGLHSEIRVCKPATGEHTKRTPEKADAIIREMATRWSNSDIAATLNRMGCTTGQGNTWNVTRVAAFRQKARIAGYESAVKDGQCLTMSEAATVLKTTHHTIRRLIQQKVLPARQVVPDAPWQILAIDLERSEVKKALRRRHTGRGRPCRNSRDDRTLKIPGT